MARYRITHWRDIPATVEATDGRETVRVALSQRFQDLIDTVAVREGATESGAYLEGWEPGAELERAGAPAAVAAEVARELEAGFEALLRRRLLGPPR